MSFYLRILVPLNKKVEKVYKVTMFAQVTKMTKETYKTIKIKLGTWTKCKKYAKYGDTQNTIIAKILTKLEKCKK